jgi:hypothetical protein
VMSSNVPSEMSDLRRWRMQLRHSSRTSARSLGDVGLIAFTVAAARRLAQLPKRDPGAAVRERAKRRHADEAKARERRRKVS